MMLIQLLVGLLVLAIVIYVTYLVLNMLELPPQVRQIVGIILALVFLLVLLSYVGIIPGWGGVPVLR